MATITTGTGGTLRMDQIDLAGFWSGTPTEHTASRFTVDAGDGLLKHVFGSALGYDPLGELVSGTITGLRESEADKTTFFIADLSTSVSSFATWVEHADTPTALTTMLAGDDTVTGDRFDDYMTGIGGHDYLMGGDGADTLLGNAGNDHLYGQSANGGSDEGDLIDAGDGSDYLQGNAGDDTLDGGNGSDRIYGGANDDLITGAAGNDTINGNHGNDMIDGGDGNDSLRGGQDDDLIHGGSGDDQLMGDVGNDSLLGGDGNDLLQGGAYNDTLDGGAGNDTLDGGFGNDILIGGASEDVFKFDRYSSSPSDDLPVEIRVVTPDRIVDFTHGDDHISLGFVPTAVLSGTVSDNQGAAAATALMAAHPGYGEVVLMQQYDGVYLYASATGTSDTVDLWIAMDGVSATSFTIADFV